MVKRLVVCVVVTLMSVSNAADDAVMRYTTTATDLYACPRLDCDVVTTLDSGVAVAWLDTESGELVGWTDAWHRVDVDGRAATGYLPEAYLSDHPPDFWKTLPVVPAFSATTMDIYGVGQAMGNDPASLSIVGDCQNVTELFLAPLLNPDQHSLGDHAYLQQTIDHYAGAFSRTRAAVRGGYNVASVLSPLWSDAAVCDLDETPLLCENRVNNPSVVIISMETWYEGDVVPTYEGYLRQGVAFWIEQGVVPILATKGGDLPQDDAINAAIARVALAYDVPLWNFWAAVAHLPDGGIHPDDLHLTVAPSLFDNDEAMQFGWPWRNLTALQVLDAFRMAVDAGA